MTQTFSPWPTQEQELLLKASLLEGSDALAAWGLWKSRVDIDRLDGGSLRQLPLLYWNLRSHEVTDPLMGGFKRRFRHTWFKNQMVCREMAPLIRTLQEAGIQTMLLKGAALIALYYEDFGLRPMGDIDLLVPQEHARRAFDILSELGWRPKKGSWKVLTEVKVQYQNAESLADAQDRQLDFHWHVLPECCWAHADDDFWDAAATTEYSGVPVHALNPSDQLLHLFVHGAKRSPAPPFRWVADAMTVIRSAGPKLDWQRLVAQAEKRRLILPVRACLSYLQSLLGAPVPASTLATLHRLPTSRVERLEFKAATHRTGLLGTLPQTWVRYLRHSQGASGGLLYPQFAGFPGYLRHIWGQEHAWQLPFRAVSRGARIARAKVRGQETL